MELNDTDRNDTTLETPPSTAEKAFPMPRNKSITILQGRAKLTEPTESHRTWRIIWTDPVTGRRRQTSGGNTREQATAKAAELLGDYIDDRRKGTVRPPTLNEVWKQWLDENAHRLSHRTVNTYSNLAHKVLRLYGPEPITTITPAMLRQVDTTTIHRPLQIRLQGLVREMFTIANTWTHRDPEEYAKAIRLTGGKSEGYQKPVKRGDVPSHKWVASVIVTAYHTVQIGPLDDPKHLTFDPITGTKVRSTRKAQFARGLGLTEPTDREFLNGLPDSVLQGRARRRIPAQYGDQMKRLQQQTERIAKQYRLMGLVVALGAGGGLRLGETLALRVRHVLSRELIAEAYFADVPRERRHWRGTIQILEQESKGDDNKIWLSKPKMENQRTVHIPMFLPCWNGFSVNTQRLQIAEIVNRFANDSLSLWNATDAECKKLWLHGFCPLGQLMWQRLDELWQQLTSSRGKDNTQDVINDYLDLLLFPTMTPPRKNKTGLQAVRWDENWPYRTRIVEGTGTYQAFDSIANIWLNPLYDYVSEIYDEWPESRIHSKRRKGWTSHALRHYAASSRIMSGVPLPLVARELGHASGAFTLQRYGHFLPDTIGDRGFEY